MAISIDVHLAYAVSQPCDMLLQIEAAAVDEQRYVKVDLCVLSNQNFTRVPALDGVGDRIWVHAETFFECRYSALIEVTRPPVSISTLPQTELSMLPGDAVQYLMASRYCHLSRFDDVITTEFSGLSGGAFIAAARDWIEANFRYDNGVSNEFTNAHDTLYNRAGVCRDFAHVLIVLARSVAIPARIVSVYGPDVQPQDFHAVVEVYLDGAWHLVDPTGMADPTEVVKIGVGRDAADVSFLTAYGFMQLQAQSVSVRCV